MYHIGLVIKWKNSRKMFSTESATYQKLNRCQLWVIVLLYWLPRCHSGKDPLPMQEMQKAWVLSLDWEDPEEKKMASRSNILEGIIPWTEEPGRLQLDWATEHAPTCMLLYGRVGSLTLFLVRNTRLGEMGYIPGSHTENCISASRFGAPSHPSLMIFHFVTLPSTA